MWIHLLSELDCYQIGFCTWKLGCLEANGMAIVIVSDFLQKQTLIREKGVAVSAASLYVSRCSAFYILCEI